MRAINLTQKYLPLSGDNRVVLDIGGNRFRLVAWVNCRQQAVYVKWLGTHSEYDRIDVETVGL